jgi:hypothetical protein
MGGNRKSLDPELNRQDMKILDTHSPIPYLNPENVLYLVST